MRDNRVSPQRPQWFALASAVGLVALTVLLRWQLAHVLNERAVFLIFLPAVVLSAYVGGLWPGVLATVLGAACARLIGWRFLDWSAAPPGLAEVLQLAIFLATGAFISLVTEHLRRARRRADDAADALARADERYRSFIERSGEGIWRFELDEPLAVDTPPDQQVAAFFEHGYLAECNDAMARMYGYERAGDITGARLGELLVPGDPRNVEYLRRFVDGGYRLSDHESHERDKDGRPRVFLNNLVGVVEHGRLVRVWGTQRDVTEQHAQREHLNLYREIFANSNDGIAVIDAHGTYLEQNAAHRALTGYADEDLRDQTPAIHMGAEQFDRVVRELEVTGSWRGETVSRVKGGQEIAVEMSAFAVRGADGRPVCYVGIKRDAGARKRAEARLTAEHAVTRILADAASLDEAAPAIVRAVRDSLHARVGELWLPDEAGAALRCAQTDCDGSDERLAAFCDECRAHTFARGVGLPGRVWASGRAAWIADLGRDENFPRRRAARDARLCSGMAFPVAHGGEFFGVMEFFTDHPAEPDAALLSMMQAIGSEVGQFIRRRRAEHELRRSQRELADFVENATVGLHWVGPDGTILWANQAELDMLGYAREEYVGRHVADFHADAGTIDEIMRCLTSGRTLRECPARLRCKDGSVRHVLIDSNVLWEDGKFVHTRCFTRDVTEQKRAEDALRHGAETLRLALEAARSGTWEWDVGSGRVTWSAGLERIHGLAPGTFAGTFDASLADCHRDDRERVERAVRETLAARRDLQVEYRLALPGEPGARWVELRGKLFCDASGAPQRVVGVCADITDRKRAEHERDELLVRERQARAVAERASRAKDEFLAVLSHELRTPLTPVLLTVTLMEGYPGLSEGVRRDLATVRRNVELEARLIDDLLDLTRIARGKLKLDLQTADAHALVRSACEICNQGEEVKLTIDLAATRHHVRGDPARLQQVFWNLLNNAYKFTPAGGRITVTSRNTPDGKLRVEVTDTGVGIDPELLPRIFAAFEQGHTEARRFGGLGLGLAISKALVDAQGGRLAARSDGPGKGATFVVELPTVRAPLVRPATQPGGAHDASRAGRRLRILIVEDHEPTRYVMTKLLADLGHSPVSAGDVGSAMQAARDNPIDLVISDLGLPDGSGHELMKQIRRQYDVRGIALSGYGMEEDLRRSEEAGFAEHLTKPVDLGRLEAAIRRVTAQPAIA